ncbi:hypothetical protein HRE53_17200 [Acaryochloris sp. 'Moss Beach']|nr:hypothetical protein HRE53_17200 [Acaryochloris sp. 'Moss Beach']
MNGYHRQIWSVSFSPDGQWVASGSSDRTVKLWNAETGVCYATLEGHHSLISSVAFHPHLPILVSGRGRWTDLALEQYIATLGVTSAWAYSMYLVHYI